jgi:nitrogen fixation NifU-like protein
VDDDGIISDVKFNTFGCGSAIATSSIATEMIKGKSIDEALGLSNKAVVEALDGLPANKIHCSVLAEEAVRAAVKNYYDNKGIAYDPELFKESEDSHETACELPLPGGLNPADIHIKRVSEN